MVLQRLLIHKHSQEYREKQRIILGLRGELLERRDLRRLPGGKGRKEEFWRRAKTGLRAGIRRVRLWLGYRRRGLKRQRFKSILLASCGNRLTMPNVCVHGDTVNENDILSTEWPFRVSDLIFYWKSPMTRPSVGMLVS